MQLRLSALTPFLLAALVRGQIERDGAAGDASTGPLTAKDLAALPKPDAAPLPVVPCEGALLEDYELYLKDYPEKKYGTEVGALLVCQCVQGGWIDRPEPKGAAGICLIHNANSPHTHSPRRSTPSAARTSTTPTLT